MSGSECLACLMERGSRAGDVALTDSPGNGGVPPALYASPTATFNEYQKLECISMQCI